MQCITFVFFKHFSKVMPIPFINEKFHKIIEKLSLTNNLLLMASGVDIRTQTQIQYIFYSILYKNKYWQETKFGEFLLER